MPKPPENTSLGESISEIIERTTTIVHEEIELAKAEMAVAAQDLLRGSVAGIVGGVFAFFGLFILLIALSFLVADAIGTWYPWLGFFIVAFLCFAVGGLLAFVALKKIKKGSAIVPEQAISEAKQTKEALKAKADEPIETIDSVAVEEPSPGVTTTSLAEPVTPARKADADPAVKEAKEDLKEARIEADGLELDAKELKKRAKQEAKEAKEAAKAAKVAEQEAAKAEAVAAKAAEKAEKEAEKARAKAEKDAKKAAKKGGGEPAAPEAPAAPPQQPAAQAKPYTPPTPPSPPQAPQQPPAPPSQTPPAPTPPPQTPPAPPSDTSKPYDPKKDN